MADATPPQPPTPPRPQDQPPFTHPNPVEPQENELTIVSHSNLFYWWPVWAVSLILGALTLFERHVMAVMPSSVNDQRDATITYISKEGDKTVTNTLEHQTVIFVSKEKMTDAEAQQAYLHVTRNKTYGVVFTFVLLVVIFITNVPLRGMWSLVIIILIAFVILLLGYFEVWDWVFNLLSSLDIRTTAGGYFVIGIALFALWLVTFMFFDRQTYITVTPGNFKVCTEIGGGEHVYDTVGMQLEKQRSDLFRHWILGMGSGDLIVRTSGAQNVHIDLPNVLFIGRKVQQIENLIKKKSVVEAR
jgi:hypothetical protein